MLDKHETDNLKFNLARRLELIENLQSALAGAGLAYRQIMQADTKLKKSFDGVLNLPEAFTVEGLKSATDAEFAFQCRQGDPKPGGFLSSVEQPRRDLIKQMDELHSELMKGA